MSQRRKHGLSRIKTARFAISTIAVSAALAAFASALSLDQPLSIHRDEILSWFTSCMAAGIGEELVFRLILFRLIWKGLECRGTKQPFFPAAFIQAALFGLLHASSANGMIAPEGAVEWVQFVGKPVQAFFFGLLMSFLYERTETLIAPIVAHVCYDLACFFPSMVLAGVDVASHITGAVPDMVALVITTVFFAVALFIGERSRS